MRTHAHYSVCVSEQVIRASGRKRSAVGGLAHPLGVSVRALARQGEACVGRPAEGWGCCTSREKELEMEELAIARSLKQNSKTAARSTVKPASAFELGTRLSQFGELEREGFFIGGWRCMRVLVLPVTVSVSRSQASPVTPGDPACVHACLPACLPVCYLGCLFL